MWDDFRAFLLKDNIVGLAIAVIIGLALNKLVGSVVDDLVMPLIGLILPSGAWQTAMVGPFRIGNFLAAVLNFLVIGFVCWRISKIFIREKKAA
jgi:large conductance mechanosensitive channel